MNQNVLLIGLLIGALFLLRRPTGWAGDRGFYTGGAGTGYGIDIWGDEG
jgi:hypothetical protein